MRKEDKDIEEALSKFKNRSEAMRFFIRLGIQIHNQPFQINVEENKKLFSHLKKNKPSNIEIKEEDIISNLLVGFQD
ncbi:MAG: hypothetical protein N2043_01920 [Ignavibacterium sp.]|nr:hypothetical protein [Ignavibacterium sp.]